ncbi:Condensin-2 complex subunit H2, partial [Charadrius vociferus]
DDMPEALEDDVEMTPAANEHIEAQRVGVGAMSLPGPFPKAPLRQLCWLHPCSLLHQEMLDPWKSLDPFADSEDKPFKKGRPFLVPHGVDDMVGGKRKRKGPRKLQDFMKWFSAAFDNVADSRKTRRKGPTFA